MSKPTKSGYSQLQEDALRYVLAGMSTCCGATTTHPIDVIKIRMQLDNELALNKSSTDAFKNRYYTGIIPGLIRIVKDDGFFGLYRGLAPSLLREGSYSTIRLGLYEPMKRFFGATDPHNTPLYKKICAGAVSGATGSAIATPTDLVKVRLQARRKPGEPPRYASVFAAFRAIYTEEGVRGLWRGVGPTVQRAAIVTATQVPTYDHTKHTILNYGWLHEGIPLHIVSSMCAGFMAACTTSPIDGIKTRIMNQNKAGGEVKYKNSWDCALKIARYEGPLAFYKGFFPNWLRMGPHTIVTFFVFEQLRRVSGLSPI